MAVKGEGMGDGWLRVEIGKVGGAGRENKWMGGGEKTDRLRVMTGRAATVIITANKCSDDDNGINNSQ